MPDPNANNPDPTIDRDFRAIPEPDTAEAARVASAMEMFTNAANARRLHEPMAFESLAMYLGQQYLIYNQTSNQMQSMRRVRAPHTLYESRNKIRPKVKKLLARALHNSPDSTVSPDTQSAQDRAAAMQGRAVLAHLDQALDSSTQLWRAARWCTTSGTAWLKQWWDPSAEAEVPAGWNPETGEIKGSARARVGDICEEIRSFFDVYPDPRASHYSQLRYIIEATSRSIEEVRDKYPENGWKVKGESGPAGSAGYIASRMATTVGEYPRGSEPGQSGKSVMVYEFWIKPVRNHREPRFRKGQWLTIAGGRIMLDRPLPAWLNGELPYTDLSYEPGQETCQGLNAVWDMVGAQRAYNNAVSRISEHLRTMYGKILAPEGCRIDATAFDSARPNEVVYYKPGPGIPQHIPAPPLPQFTIDVLKVAASDMDDISGVHEISEGTVPTGVTAAAAIKLLQDSDTTQMADFTKQIERFVRMRDNRRLRLAKAYYREPRLVFVSQTAGQPLPAIAAPGAPGAQPQLPQTGGQRVLGPGPVPGQLAGSNMGPAGQPAPQGGQGAPDQDVPGPVMQAMSFEALAGGSCRANVTPGSATPKSPEAQFEQVIELFKAGLFGPPGDPTAAQIVLKLLDYTDPSPVVEAMETARAKAIAELAATQPDPMALQAQKLQMTEQIQSALEAIKVHGQLQLLEGKSKIDAQLLELKAHYEGELEAIKLHGLTHIAELKTAAEVAPKAPDVVLKGELGPVGAASAEEHADLEPDDPAELRELQEPPAREPGGPVKGGGASK